MIPPRNRSRPQSVVIYESEGLTPLIEEVLFSEFAPRSARDFLPTALQARQRYICKYALPPRGDETPLGVTGEVLQEDDAGEAM
jgi:hypothetical protein